MVNLPSQEALLRDIKQHPLTVLVMVVCGVFFILLQTHGLRALAGWFMPASHAELFQLSNIWKLWTPIFVHYTPTHLLANVALWWIFATRIEKESRAKLLFITLIAAAVSNYCQWYYRGPDFGGLSGVDFALLGYVWLLYRFGGKQHYRFDPILGILMLALIPVAATGYFGKYSDYAHVSGLLCGIVLAGIKLLRLKMAKQ
ncbi:MAG: rhomboid family intramembrane serine protease [Gammaproteobacteria bacterium]|nr:rhomboid family intramembrane serine protease [Gammaproteobacteria bacterium]MDH5650687.1 rhomboid family intramembrane serine protease [Gammaproteobacteria bacterium]